MREVAGGSDGIGPTMSYLLPGLGGSNGGVEGALRGCIGRSRWQPDLAAPFPARATYVICDMLPWYSLAQLAAAQTP